MLGLTRTRIHLPYRTITMDKAGIVHTGAGETPIHPRLVPQMYLLSPNPRPIPSSASLVPSIQRPQSSPPRSNTGRDDTSVSSPDPMSHLHRSAPSIVKTRSGSVLSRGFILKTDHYPSGEPWRTGILYAVFADTHKDERSTSI